MTSFSRFVPAALYGGLPITFHVGIGLVLLLPFLGACPAAAQVADSSQLRRFQRAEALLRSGEVDPAIDLLETLYEASPERRPFYQALKDAYEKAKRYEDALTLVEARAGETPTAALRSEQARLLSLSGQEDAAAEMWSTALAAEPEEPSTYRTVFRSLMDLRRYDRAIDVLQQARAALDQSGAFRMEMARAYSLDGQHEEAMTEYVALLDTEPDRVHTVRDRLRSFVQRGEGLSASIEVLQAAVEDTPFNPAYRRLLAWLHMKNDNYDGAFDVYRALDRIEEQNGVGLYRFARQAADADRYETATRALALLLDRHPEGPVAARAQRALGDSYRRWAEQATEGTALGPALARTPSAQFDSARSAYRAFLEQHPDHDESTAVLADLGSLQLDVYRTLDSAEETLQRVIQRAPGTDAARTAQYDLGRIALLRGDFNRARVLFSRLADELRSGDLANQARFELARLQFYRGEFEAARTQAEAVTANTSADVANDALTLTVLLQQNQGPDSSNTPLRLYADAQLFQRKQQLTDADRRLDSLLTAFPRHPLADDARYQRATVQLALEDTTAARALLTKLLDRHPESSFAGRSLFRLGSLQEAQGNFEEAAATFDRLLTEHPNSLLAGKARNRLRALRQRPG